MEHLISGTADWLWPLSGQDAALKWTGGLYIGMCECPTGIECETKMESHVCIVSSCRVVFPHLSHICISAYAQMFISHTCSQIFQHWSMSFPWIFVQREKIRHKVNALQVKFCKSVKIPEHNRIFIQNQEVMVLLNCKLCMSKAFVFRGWWLAAKVLLSAKGQCGFLKHHGTD